MDAVETAASQGYGPGILEGAVEFALEALDGVTGGALPAPTPCRDWDLGMLLRHTGDSLAALLEAVDTGRVGLVPEADPPPEGDPADALVVAFRAGAERLLGAWTEAGADLPVTVGGCPLRADVVAATGAIEIAVHGWDVAQATGRPRPIPPALAERLLGVASVMVTGATRHGLFAPPVAVPAAAGPGERLLAHLGRDPAAWPG
ncbi:TIGR03086 family protein [Actinomadura graeca]|uniref:TIGR03086 family protein n=1 Tax=Actinomadura graeca TaxID=2750812 RepID=A0ABX8R7A5_9ACTN|nr:TIGR03086 family metal-binding protein [Actinomadura graeca]QXJ26314.1 TIGR03086 family protein [Actinomadura graeca]